MRVHFVFKLGGVPSDPTGAVTFSNAEGTLGVTRMDGGAVVVAAGTPLLPDEPANPGHFHADVAEPEAGLVYNAYVRAVHNGVPFHFQFPVFGDSTGDGTYLTKADLVERYGFATILDLSQLNKGLKTIDDSRLGLAIRESEDDLADRLGGSSVALPITGLDDADRGYLKRLVSHRVIQWLYDHRTVQSLDSFGRPVATVGASHKAAFDRMIRAVRRGESLRTAARRWTTPSVYVVTANDQQPTS